MKDSLKKIRRQKNLMVGGAITLIVAAMALFAPWLAPYDPIDHADLLHSEEPPNRDYLFGTDNQGRDILSRVIYGARISLTVGLVSQGLNSLIGIFLGLTAGFIGRQMGRFRHGSDEYPSLHPLAGFCAGDHGGSGARAAQHFSGPGLYELGLQLPHHPVAGSFRPLPGLRRRRAGAGLRPRSGSCSRRSCPTSWGRFLWLPP